MSTKLDQGRRHIRYRTEEWARLREEFTQAQAGQCAICRKNIREAASLDHCHTTGFVRGVLCTSCNTKLGWYEKRREAIERYLAIAAEHIARPSGPTHHFSPLS